MSFNDHMCDCALRTCTQTNAPYHTADYPNDYGQEQSRVVGFPLPKSDSPFSAYQAPLSREDTLRPTPRQPTKEHDGVASFRHSL